MARRTAGGIATQASVGRANGNPPPSTLAAKIVDSRPSITARQPAEGRELFSKLLQEYLNDPAIEEASVETSAKLVLVVAEAGLDAANRSDPFSPDHELDYTRDSLAVIKLTVERVPSVLFYTESSDASAAGSVVFLSLLPKIISLFGKPQLGAVRGQATNLLTACIAATANAGNLWMATTTLADTIVISAEDLISDLEKQSGAVARQPLVTSIDTPSHRAIAIVQPSHHDSIVLSHGVQVNISNPLHAAYAALGLLQSLSDFSSIATRATDRPSFSGDWLWESCHRLSSWLTAKIQTGKGPTQLLKILCDLCRLSASLWTLRGTNSAHANSFVNFVKFLRPLLETKLLLKSTALQQEVKSLLQMLHAITRGCSHCLRIQRELLQSLITNMTDESESFQQLQADLQILIETIKTQQLPQVQPDKALQLSHRAARSVNEVHEIQLRQDTGIDGSRPRKRQRISETTAGPSYSLNDNSWMQTILKIFDLRKPLPDADYQDTIIQKFSTMSATDQELVVTAMAELPCSHESALLRSTRVQDETAIPASCCRSRLPTRSWSMSGAGKEYFQILSALVGWQGLHRLKKCRLLAMIAVRRLVEHVQYPELISIETSTMGQWCLKALHSSLRELRIAAVQTMASFLSRRIPEPTRRSNYGFLVDFLRVLTDRSLPNTHEILVMAWAQIAQVCDEDELNTPILQLVESLGSTHPLVCAVAHTELELVASTRGVTLEDLFRPFWRTMAVTIVRDFSSRPQKLQRLCELLGVNSVGRFLLQTQAETIPYLVLTRNWDVLRRIATARNLAVKDICLQPPKHLGLILATLLLQNFPQPEQTIMELLCELAPEFSNTDLPALIRLEPITTACEMFKAAGDANEADKHSATEAIKTFAALAERKGQAKLSAKSSKVLAQFLETHVLGILTRFSDVVDAPGSAHSLAEKRRCIRAISEMVLLASPHFNFSIAIPQIKACLQAAINEPALCNDAFATWADFVSSLEDDDIESLIEHTFAIIVRTWSQFSAQTQQRAHALIADLIKSHNAAIRDKIAFVPSFHSIPLLSKYESEIAKFKAAEPFTKQLEAFTTRCSDENYIIVEQALRELPAFLEDKQKLLQEAASAGQPDPVIWSLLSSLVDAASRFAEDQSEISILSAKCLGLIGCVDLNKFDAAKQQREVTVLSNFDRVTETVEFVAFLLEHVLIKAFHSATNGRVQNYLAWAMQELLKHCDFKTALQRSNAAQTGPQYQRWASMSESARNTLMPYFHTKYLVNQKVEAAMENPNPIFRSSSNHADWLRDVVYDLLKRGRGENAKIFFPVLLRIIKGHDLSIPSFLLPYVVTNVILAGTDEEKEHIELELLAVLECDLSQLSAEEAENVKKCSENIFQVLDYLSRWLQRKRKYLSDARTLNARTTANSLDFDELKEVGQISSVEKIVAAIPSATIARRAMDCRAFSRALFHWEQHLRTELDSGRIRPHSSEQDAILDRLQDIYTQIDEPDGIEGISAQLHFVGESTQVLEHRVHGRWAAAQSWYELELSEAPNNEALQSELLSCLRDSGQFGALLSFVEKRQLSGASLVSLAFPFAAEAAWCTEQFQSLQAILSAAPPDIPKDFALGVASALLALRSEDTGIVSRIVASLREEALKGLSPSSLKASHRSLLRLHALYEIEKIAGARSQLSDTRENLLDMFDSRLQLLGADTADKQYLLGIRRAALSLSRLDFTDRQRASLWLTSARLARKANFHNVAFDCINHASRLDTEAALIEQSRLLWKNGSHKKAIQTLQGAISADAFHSYDTTLSTSMITEDQQQKWQNALLAKAQLLLAKWTDQAGQVGSQSLMFLFQTAVKSNSHWEKGHYYLGHYYNKLLETEKTLPIDKQSTPLLSGETAKLVIENYLRSVGFGAKYHYQTVPKLLTLWLDFAQEVHNDLGDGPGRHAKDERQQRSKHIDLRLKHLDLMQKQIKKYVDRLSPYIFYNAFPQIISRIGHPHKETWETMAHIILRIASFHPQQALWSLLAVAKSTVGDKAYRGQHILSRLKQEASKRDKAAASAATLRVLISQGQKLTESLLTACEGAVDARTAHVSLSRDLHFNHKLAPCGLVVPIEKTMTAILPTGVGMPAVRNHKAFPYGFVQIEAFHDDVLVLSSLQRPRKLTVRGSDGQLYGLLCKPKDDLRKDQRLMEFNAMIKRALKRDVEASKRQLYIKTYGVVPLNEECGTIEWVDGLKPMRDIIISNYKAKGTRIDYTEIRNLLNDACSNPPKSIDIFTDKILGHFKPVLHEWFTDTFPDPETWYAARLRYARSCAVMSIVGHVLGLGDRHGENVLLESSSGGVFHVDFNCLFDKGLTFEKPEKVPFRLTHNMVHAFGACGVEGPFRKSAEVTLKVLRQYQDTLMTIMETFLYDPTADFLGSHRRKKSVSGVPETPQEVLESVRDKLRGLMFGEKVPLSVEGYVDGQISLATDPQRLAEMYIGWCAFF